MRPRLPFLLTAIFPVLASAGCRSVIIAVDHGPGKGGEGGQGGSLGSPPSASGEVDVLIIADNSPSMADKQRALATAVPSLLEGMINPPCVDGQGTVKSQPTGASEACPAGSKRRFRPVTSMHVGVIDSSLGAVGADQCDPAQAGWSNDDRAHLITRGPSGPVPTYLDQGFLAWDSAGDLAPPGETILERFVGHASDLVAGAGEVGCGYEMPLESAQRFLVDPAPYDHIEGGDISYSFAKPVGIDDKLLAERAQFLRPDSLVVVVLLSDENDCSIDVGTPDRATQNYGVLNQAPFFRGSSICESDPLDACCYSCGLGAPAGCASDPSCGAQQYLPGEDGGNIRCFHEKQRYGYDALYPVERYVNAFSSTIIDPSKPDLGLHGDTSAAVGNPLFAARNPSSLIMTSIVGVPLELIAVDPQNPEAGIMGPEELASNGVWGAIAGDPSSYVEPSSPLMVESTQPRPGVTANDPNGGDHFINPSAPNDLEFACISPLAAPLSGGPACTVDQNPGPRFDNPVCDPVEHTTQVAMKAYPGLRELAVVQGLGHQGRVGSICEPSVHPAQAPGYSLVVTSLLDRIAESMPADAL